MRVEPLNGNPALSPVENSFQMRPIETDESVTVAAIDGNWQPIAGTEKTFAGDTILIAVGLDPCDEFLRKAKELGLPVHGAGDAEEIAEALAAMFTGRIRGLEVARRLGRDVGEVPPEWHRTTKVLKSRPGAAITEDIPEDEHGCFPVILCSQEIPCNPCTSVCPHHAIRWLDRDDLLQVPPDLNREGLRGDTFSPEDGSASPMMSSHAFYLRAKALGVQFRFNERVTSIIRRRGEVVGVRTDKGGYATPTVVNAGGPWARSLAQMGGLDVPVVPDSHEGGVTEPVASFLGPMLVDIRPAPGSKNYYFYQHKPGAVVFRITPDPRIIATDRRETSSYLPKIARRMVDLAPKLANIKVWRTWRGLYAMTPDGSPIVGWLRKLEGYAHAVGMCGQGYMLGPGVGALVSRFIRNELSPGDQETLDEMSPYREFGGNEALR
jgi:sarcosine oxidase subunit beta